MQAREAGWDSGGWSGHVELVAALAPPGLRVVLRDHRPARRHRHVDRVARRAVAALGRAQRRIRSRPSASSTATAAQLPTPPRRRLLRPPALSWHQRHTRAKMCREQRPGSEQVAHASRGALHAPLRRSQRRANVRHLLHLHCFHWMLTIYSTQSYRSQKPTSRKIT